MIGRLSKQEAADLLGVSVHWINERLKAANQDQDITKTFKAYVTPRKIGRKVYFSKIDLDAYMNRERKQTPAQLRAASLSGRLGFTRSDQTIDFALHFLEASLDNFERENWMEEYTASRLRAELCALVKIADPMDR